MYGYTLGTSDAFLTLHFMTENVRFPQKRLKFVSLRGRIAAVAILKPKAWHPVTKHGSTKRQKSRNSDPSRSDTTTALLRKCHFTRTEVRISHASAYFTCPKGKFHCAAPAVPRSGIPSRSVKDCRVGRKKCALLAMTRLIGFAGKRNGFQNETFEKRCRATPRGKAA